MLHQLNHILLVYFTQYEALILACAALFFFAVLIRASRRTFLSRRYFEQMEILALELERIASALELLGTSQERIDNLFKRPFPNAEISRNAEDAVPARRPLRRAAGASLI